MTPAARLAATIKIIDEILRSAKPADQVMHAYLQPKRYIGSKDRRAISNLTFVFLRHYARLGWWCETYHVAVTGRNFAIIWLAVGERMPLNEIHSHFGGAAYAPDALTQSDHNLLQKIHGKVMNDKKMPLAIQCECPPLYQHALQNAWGDQFKDEMQALDSEAPLDLRVNTLKATRDVVFGQLQQDGFQVELTPLSPIGIRVTGRPAFSAHDLYKNGSFEVQDEGSQLLSLLCGVKPGEWGADLCAGAGGKTLALAAVMKNKGRLWACDVDGRRLENAKLRIKRAGVDNVELQPLRDMQDVWIKKHSAKCDFVLIDAPCSGTGTWRRSPFSRWQDLGPSLDKLMEMQSTALNAAAPLIKPGGRLIYATCSLLPQENQNQVKKFLDTYADFAPVPLNTMWTRAPATSDLPVPDALDLSSHMLSMTPLRHNTDGFFVGVVEKKISF